MTSLEREKNGKSTEGIMPDGTDINFWSEDATEAEMLRAGPRVPAEIRARIRTSVSSGLSHWESSSSHR